MTNAAEWWLMAELCIAMADASPELERLRAIGTGLDGYGTGGSERSGPGTTANPTLAVLVALAGGTGDSADVWVVPNDQIGLLLGKLADQSAQMAGCARRIAGLKRLIDGRADSRVGRQSTVTDCLACEASVSGVGADRVRSGYCPACHQAWLRFRSAENGAGRSADHELFRRQRRKSVERNRERAS